MYFTHRPMQVSDLENCFSIARERFLYDADPGSRKKMTALAEYLLRSGAEASTVIENSRFPKGKRQVAFGLTVFITDGFLHQARTRLPPFFPLQMAERWAGKEKFFLDKDQIERANTGEGVNIATLSNGWDEKRLSPEELFKVHHLLMQRFIAIHSGFRIKEYLAEGYGDEMKKLSAILGGRLRRDYRELLGTPGLPEKYVRENHPYLIGFTAAEARKRIGTVAAQLCATSVEPRFHFRPGEKEVLQRALTGETDEALARGLKVSLSAIKKRWQGIYEKVEVVDPELLEPSVGRPQQRRRALLEYLRYHPEELRPTKVSQRKKAR